MRDGDGATGQVAWILAAAALGFAMSAFFSGVLRLERSVFLVPYVVATAAFVESWRRHSAARPGEAIRAHAAAGAAGATAATAFVVWSVLRQPSSAMPEHAGLAVLWLGVVYGVADALLLSVLPVSAARRAFRPRSGGLLARAVSGATAVAASVFVTAAYHLGYAEFRGASLAGPVIGCGVMSLAYVVTGNPLAALVSHVAMHVAAVLHGVDSTVQLPPHR